MPNSQVADPDAILITPLRRLGLFALFFFVFVAHSRVFDVFLHDLHIPSISLYAAIVAAFLAGGLLRAFSHRVGICFLALTFWISMAFPFSTWRGGSVLTVKNWFKSLLFYFILVGLVFAYEHFRATLNVLAISVAVLSLVALGFGQLKDGRLLVPNGRFANPNDLAQMLLMGLPFLWFVVSNPRVKKWRRIAAALATGPVIFAMSRTGSRGALLGTAVVLAIVFLRSSLKHKVQFGFSAVVLIGLAIAFLPVTTKERFTTFLHPDDQIDDMSHVEGDAITSMRARWLLLQDSVALTLRHPVFGVGPGVFDVAQDLYSWQVRGTKGLWEVTHNTYTEMSSENGIPAFIFLLITIIFTYRAAILKKPRGTITARQAEILSASFAIRLATIAYAVSAFFASFAYQPQLPLLAGLAVVFNRVAAREFAAAMPASPPRPAVTWSERIHPVMIAAARRRRTVPAGAA